MVPLTDRILDHFPDPTILLDARRAVRFANAAARDLLDITRVGQDLAMSLRHPRVLEAVDQVLGRAETRAVDITLPGVTRRNFEMYVAGFLPAADANGIGAVLVLRDLTTARRAEQMRADFVANASHELRSPLAALLGFIETLEGPAGDDEETRRRFLGIMLREAKRMAGLIDDLLTLSRVEINEHVRPTAPVDIAGVLLNVTEALSHQAKAANMPIRVNYGSNLPAVHGEADQLFQVFRNLIENAIRYGAKGEAVDVRVEPAARIPGTGRAGIAVKVTDHGEGIPEEAIPRLTERFYRVDKARSKSVGGTGLGLAIVKHIVNRHRGLLAVESEPGKGSTFTVYLPAEQPRQGLLPGNGETVAIPSSDVS
ncbi:MAG: two-component sensor histidine kinase [Rhodospirillales bacterium CG15_BIG_FIL_POST_REV_8_21_14_020_66_15]|nr:MAG: two-component sensor histidine kinase [Rhodospirillales bacterium CG15_BIG_FIL_POST_REV_8_21_14_020_66_15]